MPIAVKSATEDEISAGQVLLDPYLFAMLWFSDELTIEPSMEQKLMLCDQSDKILFCTGRKIAKTVCLESTVLRDCILNESDKNGVDEALFFTPGDAHLAPFVDRVFGRISKEPVLRGLLKTRRGENTIIDSPTLRYYFRVEGMTGTDRNMIGLRAKYIRGDEMALGNTVCHNSRIQTALPNAKWLYAGVPNGVRTTPFYRLDQTDEGFTWSRHKYPTFINPIYSTNERKEELARAYGGEHTQGYITQVLGQWGDEVLSSFPPGSIAIHDMPYYSKTLIEISQEEDIIDLPVKIGVPSMRCDRFVIGVDYGFSPDPTEIIVAYANKDEPYWKCYLRLELRRVVMPRQVDIIMYVINTIMSGEFLELRSDNLSLIQALQSADKKNSKRFNWAVPQGVTKVKLQENGVEKEVGVRNKEFFTSLLKRYMMAAVVGLIEPRLEIGNDAAAITELTGTTEKKLTSGYTVYFGPQDPRGVGSNSQLDHIRDALSYLCSAIYTVFNTKDEEDEEDSALEAYGWVAQGDRDWKPPWA